MALTSNSTSIKALSLGELALQVNRLVDKTGETFSQRFLKNIHVAK
jgi:hypothetical protein